MKDGKKEKDKRRRIFSLPRTIVENSNECQYKLNNNGERKASFVCNWKRKKKLILATRIFGNTVLDNIIRVGVARMLVK